MKRSEQDRLLREILADDSVEQLRRGSLDRGLIALRRRRLRRSAFASAAAALAISLAFVIAARRHPEIPSTPSVAFSNTSRVKIIDDQQLLALFPDRSVALIGPRGNQKLVFLDAPGPASARMENP